MTKKYPLWAEIVIGVVCGLICSGCSTFFGKINCPLFMDTIFTVTAAFVGWWAGIINVISYALMTFIVSPSGLKIASTLFELCVLAMVLIIRFFYSKRENVTVLSLLYVYLLCVIFVSLIGAIIATYCFSKLDYTGYYSVRYITMLFLRQRIPLIFSSFLSRIPVNAIDKLIAVFGGYGIYLTLNRLTNRGNQ